MTRDSRPVRAFGQLRSEGPALHITRSLEDQMKTGAGA